MSDECTTTSTSPLSDIDNIVCYMYYATLIECPSGFFLETNHASTLSPYRICYLTQVSSDAVNKMLAQGLINATGDRLSAEEFEIQRALGTAAYMSVFVLTLEGNSRVILNSMKDCMGDTYKKEYNYSTSTGSTL